MCVCVCVYIYIYIYIYMEFKLPCESFQLQWLQENGSPFVYESPKMFQLETRAKYIY